MQNNNLLIFILAAQSAVLNRTISKVLKKEKPDKIVSVTLEVLIQNVTFDI